MLLSKKWLNDFLKTDIADKNFAGIMTMSGSKVEGFRREGDELEKIVVARIISLERHPNSDHLFICSADVGGESPIQIVTGAQNLSAGDFVPVALDGSVTAGGKKIKKSKLRGVESDGMFCSLGELGLTAHDFPYAVSDGVFVLGGDCDRLPGADIKSAIGLDDTVFEFEITPNRPDCLSVIGLAREAAAALEMPFCVPAPCVKAGAGDVGDCLSIDISDNEKCYRYAGAVVKNVRIAPSPRWMRERLRAGGVRPINNIVDITNFVMLEYGQPMHAFDYRFLEGGSVIVRTAKKGETITTLDGVQRALSEDMLVIADAVKPVAVAGVMGGEYSGIMDDTQTIVFESACFNGPSVRSTSKKLGMRTEASARYEKGLDPKGCRACLDRALELVQLLDAGDVVNGVIDCDKTADARATVQFDPDWTNSFIGIDMSADEQAKILERLSFKVQDGIVTVPSFRGDVEHKADIAEEVARFYGFENIKSHPIISTTAGALNDTQKLQKLAGDILLAQGLTEIMTYSFISPKSYDKIMLGADSPLRKSIVISNPLGEDTSVMRTTSVPSMLEVLSRNFNNRNAAARLYELSTVYIPKDGEELPEEKITVSLGMYGEGLDFFSLKGVIEELLLSFGICDCDVEAVTDCAYLHPGRAAKLTAGGDELGIFGEVHPDVLDNYEIDTKAYVGSVDFNTLKKHADLARSYKQLPKFPATTRDLAFVCDKSLPVLTLRRAISSAAGGVLESLTLFDVYEGSQIPEGMKSVAFNLVLRSPDKTMTDEEADDAVRRSVKALEKLGISLRGQ